MLVLCSPSDTGRISNPYLQALLDLRFRQLWPFSADEGLLIVVEPGDSVDELEAASGCSLLYDPFEDVPYGHPDFNPAFDYLEKHYANETIYGFEAHADTGDGGIGTTLFIPTDEGIDPRLLAMCTTYAVPATSLENP
jgi:hypothetical protein